MIVQNIGSQIKQRIEDHFDINQQNLLILDILKIQEIFFEINIQINDSNIIIDFYYCTSHQHQRQSKMDKNIFKIVPKQEYQQINKLSKINFLSLQTLSNFLEDNITIQAYLKTLKLNRQLVEGKTVLHLSNGCNCLYAIFAASLNAKKVYCVINGHQQIDEKNLNMMREIVKENKFQDIIEVLSYKNFTYRVDLIIGQPMGYNMIYDGMIDRMIEARDLYLNQGGKIIPNIIKYKCAFIHDQYFNDHKVAFWNEVYGIPMKSMKKWIASQPVIRVVDPTLIVSDITKFLEFNLEKVTYEEIDDIQSSFRINSLRSKQEEVQVKANGITIWFEIQFSNGIQKNQIKASPWNEATRWTHMTLYSNKFWELKDGQHKYVQFTGKKNHLEGTATILMKIDGQEHVYHFA